MESNQCASCALKCGSPANLERRNNLIATFAVIAPFPFYCHREIDWRHISREESNAHVKAGRMKLCRGWVDNIRIFKAAGFYKDPDRRKIRRYYAVEAVSVLEQIMLGSDDKAEHRRSLNRMAQLTRALYREVRQFDEELYQRLQINDAWRAAFEGRDAK